MCYIFWTDKKDRVVIFNYNTIFQPLNYSHSFPPVQHVNNFLIEGHPNGIWFPVVGSAIAGGSPRCKTRVLEQSTFLTLEWWFPKGKEILIISEGRIIHLREIKPLKHSPELLCSHAPEQRSQWESYKIWWSPSKEKGNGCEPNSSQCSFWSPGQLCCLEKAVPSLWEGWYVWWLITFTCGKQKTLCVLVPLSSCKEQGVARSLWPPLCCSLITSLQLYLNFRVAVPWGCLATLGAVAELYPAAQENTQLPWKGHVLKQVIAGYQLGRSIQCMCVRWENSTHLLLQYGKIIIWLFKEKFHVKLFYSSPAEHTDGVGLFSWWQGFASSICQCNQTFNYKSSWN